VDQSQRHQREMEQYETEFEETKQEALEKISVSSGGGTAVGIRLATIVVLVISIFAAAVLLDPYEAAERRAARDVKKHFAEYTQEVETFLENRDYGALNAFIDLHDLRSNDQFREYSEIFTAAEYYMRIYQGMMELAFIDADTENLYDVKNMSRNYNSFYETAFPKRHYSWIENPEKIEAVSTQMEEDLAILAQRYLGLTKEETDSLKGLSDSRRTVIIEQAIDKKLSQNAGTSLSEIEEMAPEDAEMMDSKEMPADAVLMEEEAPQTGGTQGE
jgi:hypothetical protein